ncbi:hypothetical protein PUNSTDRAFT_122547 [Punctularia strigosozonata HHB-11173 SS5]|uniref:DUF7598 domain-containing protein n=1 Tax=Punctularia strigosozonata (strain HHB-11173) TaxID=741275 RepID=R7S5M4_PUNST|nr:uncharacterized protein PUNSTDRAFT_122547 [Punctularia strigosozonata HHB-11173 SS5]EIN05307.1 hypothetical protein PUNSTDRAFT_122547 [Punctularia strigosozonata HHB-11173 SS5]
MLPLRAYTFIGLNAIRALSIIALILMFSSSIVTLVHDVQGVNRFIEAGKHLSSSSNSTTSDDTMLDCDYIEGTTVPHQPAGAFWAVLNRLLIIFQIVILILSELGWPAKFFDTFFPVLGADFGLGPLGLFECLLGAAVLSHHVDTFALVSAFFLFSVGCLNIFIGLVFRGSARPRRSIFAWRERAKDVLPTNVGVGPIRADLSSPPPFVSKVWDGVSEKIAEHSTGESGKSGYGFGRQGEKAAGLKGFLLTKPAESLPRYAPKPSGSF